MVLEIGTEKPAFSKDRLGEEDFKESYYIPLDLFLNDASNASNRARQGGIESQAVQGDVMHLPFQDESLDEVILYDLLNQTFDLKSGESGSTSAITIAEEYFDSVQKLKYWNLSKSNFKGSSA